MFIITADDKTFYTEVLSDNLIQACYDGDFVTTIVRVDKLGNIEELDYNNTEEIDWLPVAEWKDETEL